MKKYNINNKKKGIIITAATLTLIGLTNNNKNDTNTIQNTEYKEKTEKIDIKICDGITITTNCQVDGIEYSVYKYYEAIPERWEKILK